jgi:hypothetical protein
MYTHCCTIFTLLPFFHIIFPLTQVSIPSLIPRQDLFCLPVLQFCRTKQK